MRNYKNGFSTRRNIVDACKKLFYTKGYNETSYTDICRESHVDRSTVYYHFPTKEAIRLEVQWEYYIGCKHIAESFCPDEAYVPLIASTIFEMYMQKDEKMRKFCRQICEDYPLFTGKKDLSYLYYVTYEYMWSRFWDVKRISPMAFSTVYGYIMGTTRLMCENPERYDALEMNEYLYYTCLNIWGAPKELRDEIIANLHNYILSLPETVWEQVRLTYDFSEMSE